MYALLELWLVYIIITALRRLWLNIYCVYTSTARIKIHEQQQHAVYKVVKITV